MNLQNAHRNPLTLGLLLILIGGAALAQPSAESRLDQQEIEQIVRKYILDNPEVVLESVRVYQEREQAAQKQRSRDAVAAHRRELYDDPASPVSGAANQTGDLVTIVTFFDYRCGYCKKVEETVATLAATPGVRVVYKEFPILGPESVLAAQAALAAGKQGAYQKFHRALMTSVGPVTAGGIEKIAADLRLDVAQLKKDMTSPEIDAALTQNHALAGKLGVQSTPTFVVGKELVSGALTAEAFRPLIEAARGESKTSLTQDRGL